MAARPAVDVEALYTVAPAEFTRARDALARRLREAGRDAQAKDVGRLRKPSAAVWAINRVARDEPDAIARFADAVRALRAAQLGDSGGVAQATTAERAARHEVLRRVEQALRTAGVRATKAVLGRASATLVGAAADAHARDDLRRGRLVHEHAAPGFEALVGAPAMRAAKRATVSRSGGPSRSRARAPRDETREARQAADAAARAVATATRTLHARERAATERERVVTRAAAEVDRRRGHLAQAERRSAEASQQAVAARRDVEQARADVARAEEALRGTRSSQPGRRAAHASR